MRRLSFWAAQHVMASRFIVVGCYVTAGLLGDIWAFLLYAEKPHFAAPIFYGTILIALLALFLHPKKGREKAAGYSYFWHKSCDLVICLATVVLISFCTAGLIAPAERTAASIPWKDRANPPREYPVVTPSTQAQERGLSGFVHRAAKWYKGLGKGEKAGLVALTIILTLVFCYFWAGICCSIACNGMDALAVVLFVLGAGGAIAGCVFLCRRIIRGPRAKRSDAS